MVLYNCITNLAWFLIWRFLANAHQRQIKDRIKICLHEDGIVLTAPDAKINTGKKLFWKKTANLSTRQINQLYSISIKHECLLDISCLTAQSR